jgi:hypothetical protein
LKRASPRRYLSPRRVTCAPAPDFIHPGWDLRAQREIADCDTVIFAKGEHDQQPHAMSFSDIREEEPDAEAELIAD